MPDSYWEILFQRPLGWSFSDFDLGGAFRPAPAWGIPGELRLIHIIPEAFFGGELGWFSSTFPHGKSLSFRVIWVLWSVSQFSGFRCVNRCPGFFGNWMDWRDISRDTILPTDKGVCCTFMEAVPSKSSRCRWNFLTPWGCPLRQISMICWGFRFPKNQKTEPSEHIRRIL